MKNNLRVWLYFHDEKKQDIFAGPGDNEAASKKHHV